MQKVTAKPLTRTRTVPMKNALINNPTVNTNRPGVQNPQPIAPSTTTRNITPFDYGAVDTKIGVDIVPHPRRQHFFERELSRIARLTAAGAPQRRIDKLQANFLKKKDRDDNHAYYSTIKTRTIRTVPVNISNLQIPSTISTPRPKESGHGVNGTKRPNHQAVTEPKLTTPATATGTGSDVSQAGAIDSKFLLIVGGIAAIAFFFLRK
jgi:hypothetical protein